MAKAELKRERDTKKTTEGSDSSEDEGVVDKVKKVPANEIKEEKEEGEEKQGKSAAKKEKVQQNSSVYNNILLSLNYFLSYWQLCFTRMFIFTL